MSRTVAKKTLVLKDIWIAYATEMLAANPEWWSRYAHDTPHFFIYRKHKNRVQEVMTYFRFRKIVEDYFKRAKKAIIAGEALNMLAGVGKICARRVQRDFRRKGQRRIDWHKTRQQPKVWSEEKQKMVYARYVYFVGDDWCRIGWNKTSRLTNGSVYEFAPANRNSAGTSGFRKEFTDALAKDPLLKYQYLFNPIKI